MTNYVILEIPVGPWTTVVCVIVIVVFVVLIQSIVRKKSENDADTPKDKKTGKDLDILCWNEIKTLNEILEEIDKRGFRPATAEEVEYNLEKILDLEEHFPEFQKHLPIVALGSVSLSEKHAIVLSYKAFSYEEEEEGTGDSHVISASISSLEISRTICQFAVVKKQLKTL